MEWQAFSRLHLIIRGSVQGVGFRWAFSRQARHLALTGWVKNNPDGSVEALVEGPREALEALLEWSHVGPSLAQVETVEASWLSATHEFWEFTLRR